MTEMYTCKYRYGIFQQGWTMVFKAVGGVSSPEVDHLWNSPLTLSENVSTASDITATHLGHYKNRIVLNWTTFNPQEVNLRLAYETEVRQIVKQLEQIYQIKQLSSN